MFSFHKPKVYRSTSGCCICKAKSSSSRFTDSGKYEDDLMECFKLAERRTGEICNACVLLVKRWKKLPEGSGRHWRHVVDYRAGPGSKSLVRSKTRNKKRPKLKAEVRSASPGPDDDLSSDLSVLSVLSGPNSPSESLCPANVTNAVVTKSSSRKRAKSPSPRKEIETATECGFVDPTIWKRKKVCCGVIFTGPGGIVMVDPRLLKPCGGNCGGAKRVASPNQTVADEAVSDIATHGGSTPCTTISDSSSDSGYDECSNPSAAAAAN